MSPDPAPEAGSELRGRAAEVAALSRALERVAGWQAGVVVIEGRAGMGKSRLLQEAGDIARTRDLTVVRPQPDAVTATLTAGCVLDALGVPVDQSAGRTPEATLALIEAALEEASREGPVVLLLDDLQWSDDTVVDVVRRLPRRMSDEIVLWVLAVRGDEAPAALRGALDALPAGLTRLSLEGLPADAVAQVVGDLAGAAPDAALLALANRLGGVPFLLRELSLGLLEEGRIYVRHDARAEIVGTELPARLGDDMRVRLARLTPQARRVATTGSVLGRRFRVGVLGLMLAAAPASLAAPIQELLDVGLLVDDGTALAFLHDTVRNAVLDAMPAGARKTLERQAADALISSGAPVVAVARQLAVSATAGDREAVALLHEAARQLTTTEPATAAALSHRAFELADLDDPLRGALVADTAVALHAAGRVEEGRVFADRAFAKALPAEQQAVVHLSVGGMFALSNDVRSDACRRGLDLPGLTEPVRGQLLTRLLHNVLASGRLTEARGVAERARTAVATTQDPNAVFALAVAEVGLAYVHGRYEDALLLADAAIALGGRADDDARVRLVQQWRAEVLVVLGRFDEAEELERTYLAANQRDGQLFAVRLWEDWRGRVLLHRGHLGDAAAALESLGRDGEGRPIVNGADGGALEALWRVARRTGDRPQVLHTAATARAVLHTGTPEVRRHAAWTLAQHGAAEGDLEEARRGLDVLRTLEDGTLQAVFPTDPTTAPQLVRAALAVGDEQLATRVVAIAEARATLTTSPVVHAAANHARGLLAGDVDALEQAAAGLQAGPWRPAWASVLEDLGRAQLLRTDRSGATTSFSLALTVHSRSGARWDEARVRARLASLGVRRRVNGTERPTAGWLALTASERGVARAVAEGLTNRDVAERMVISPHTVKAHLGKIYAKLGISSRVELARVVLMHDER